MPQSFANKTRVERASVAGNRSYCKYNMTNSKKPGKKLKLSFWNAQSLRNKTTLVCDYMNEHDLDIYLFAESWLKDDDDMEIGELQGNSFRYLSVPRKERQGGGVACLFKSNLNIKKIDLPRHKTFECMELNLSLNGKTITIVTVYRPEPSANNRYTLTEFFDEFTEFMAHYHMLKNEVIIVGDFNFHINKKDNANAKKFIDIIDMFNMVQHVNSPTHRDGNTLDLLITRIDTTVVDHLIGEQNSDHNNILFQINLNRPQPPKKKIRFRKFKDININYFKLDLQNKFDLLQPKSSIDTHHAEYLDKLIDTYTSAKDVLNKHAPELERVVTVRNPTPWNTADIKQAKSEKRKAEKKWRKTRNNIDYELYRESRNAYNSKLNSFKVEALAKKIKDNKGDSKNMFKAINSALNRKQELPLPPHDNVKTLANDFNDFFENKILKIREKLDTLGNSQDNTEQVQFTGEPLNTFKSLNENEVKKILLNMRNKYCNLDPLPFWLMKECIDQFLPLVTDIINTSLRIGIMPKPLKHALIKPLLKKLGLELAKKNYRPVSNLQFLGKAIESAVITQFQEHLTKNDLHDSKQSAYRKFHSTETLLMKVHNDIMSSLGKGEMVMLVLLDLSAAFDTIDHDILLNRLENTYGIKQNALSWFKSYMSDRTQSVLINGTESERKDLKYGVPQGSKLGPILFNSYIAPVSKIVEKNDIIDEKYADDQQLILSFKPRNNLSEKNALLKMEKCIQDVKIFLENNKLSNNGEKTEFLLIGSPNQMKQVQLNSIKIGDITVNKLTSVKNLGIIMDSNMNFEKQTSKMCKSAYFNIKNIAKIRKCLSKDDTKIAVNALVTPHLDYGNGLLTGIKKGLINKLQVAQNSAVRLIEKMHKHDHITESRKGLHWLPIQARIEFKILTMAWKAQNKQAPSYMVSLLKSKPTLLNLRSRDNLLQDVPNGYGTNKYADRSFCRSAPILWNKLPYEVRAKDTLEAFKRNLKTFLFKKYYD